MRWKIPAVAAGGVGVAALAVGVFALAKDDPRKRTDCLVRVFFAGSASSEQIRAVGSRLNDVDDVAVRFVSKKEALARMRKEFPELTASLASNPLPASFEARTTYADSCSSVRASLRPRPVGVDKVKSRIRPFAE